MTDERKTCLVCGKNKPLNQFYRTNNPQDFPDDRYHTCNVCVKERLGEDNGEELAKFLYEINRPFLKDVWAMAKERKNHTLGEYLKAISSTPKYMDLTYEDSDIKLEFKKFDTRESRPHLYDKEGVIIVLDDEVEKKWRSKDSEYTVKEILELEKFCRNMKYDYEISTTMMETMLDNLAMLNLEGTKLLTSGDYANYAKISSVSKDTLKDSGFRPVDKKDNLEKTGIDSLGEIIAQIERDQGFIPPNRVKYEPDDIDKVLTYYVRWAQKMKDRPVETGMVTEWREIEDEEVIVAVDPTANEDYEVQVEEGDEYADNEGI